MIVINELEEVMKDKYLATLRIVREFWNKNFKLSNDKVEEAVDYAIKAIEERDEIKEEKCHSNNFKETKKLKNDILILENSIDKYKLIVNCNEIKIKKLQSQLTTLREAIEELTQLVIEDVPHKYQDRILDKLKEVAKGEK